MIADLFNPAPAGPDALREGYFLLKKRRAGRVDVPVHIFYGQPRDPLTGELLDRSPRWQVEINGVLAFDPDQPALIGGQPVESLEGIWPEIGGSPLHEDGPTSPAAAREYQYRVERADWAEQHDPGDPFGGTGERIDPLTSTLPIFSDEVA